MEFAGTAVQAPGAGRRPLTALGRHCLLTTLICVSSITHAQTPADGPPPPSAQKREEQSPERSPSLKSLPRNIFLDQRDFWSTPFHMTQTQWRWTVPLAFTGAGLLASDTAVEKHVPTTRTTVLHAGTASNAGLAALVGAGGGMFLLGHFSRNEQQREAGLLGGEAAIDAFLDTTAFKYATGRDLPFTSDHRGRFFQGGTSFPSQHAAVSWAIASVIAHEYPGPMTKLLADGVAGGVSAARIAGKKHFATDALVGSALGWYVGRQVFRSRSEFAVADRAKWGTFSKGYEVDTGREPRYMGSSYVPLDSWIYPAFDRLMAVGYVHDRAGSLRPWSWLECARLVSEIHEYLADDAESPDESLNSLISDLDVEFGYETQLRNGITPNVNVGLDSVYSRYTDVSGSPLRDSFHFAQTLANDFGRPYGRGSNAVSGFSTSASVGPFFIYVRGEYQYGSSSQEYNTSQAQAIASLDGLPLNSVPGFGKTSRLRPVEAYAGVNLGSWQLTFGQQSLWWGAARSSSLLLSNNAEAMPMLRLDRVSPLRLPLLGQVYMSGFLARMGGTRYLRLGPNFTLYGDGIHPVDPQPYLWGGSIAFKPTANLELEFANTAVFAGHGIPLTLHNFLHTFSQRGNIQAEEPGGRRPTMTVSYRLPKLRNSVLLYADALSEAQPLPILYPRESALNAGVYLPHVPWLRHLDFRGEGVYSNMPASSINNLFYVNFHYPNGYRNYGQILGSWIGRGGDGGQASTTYWFSGHNQATVSYRRMVSNPSLLKGGNLNDFAGSLTWRPRAHIELAASVQYEKWNFPVLNSGPRSNVSSTVEIRIFPKVRAARGTSTLP